MFSIFSKQKCSEARWCSLTVGVCAMAMFIVLRAWTIDPAAAQSTAPQAYRIGVGAKTIDPAAAQSTAPQAYQSGVGDKTIDPAAAQSTAPQAYRIGIGDKIGVVVIGQPDLSGDGTVDQGGNLRLPVLGDIHAVNLTPSELEKNIIQSLEQGYLRRPVVSVKIAEFRPIYVLGMVRTPGIYPYQQGQSVIATIARAGGIGASEQSGMARELFQADERVRLLEISRAALLTKRARLIAQQDGDDRINFPEMPRLFVDPATLSQIRDGEQRTLMEERQAEQLETQALKKQLPRLDAELASLKQQGERIARLARDSAYGRLLVEAKREEARIEENIARLNSDSMRAALLAIGELQFKITELHSNYQRRVTTELRQTDRSLLELTVTLPSARRAHAARALQMRLPTEGPAQQSAIPAITVIRAKGTTIVKYDADIDFLLQPGDVVQVGSLLPPAQELPPDQLGTPGERVVIAAPPEAAIGARPQ